MFGFVINYRFNTGPTLSECLDLLIIQVVPDTVLMKVAVATLLSEHLFHFL